MKPDKQQSDFHYSSSVKLWIICGLVMLMVQVIVGGVTRLTGSGLSITEWEPITGILPPLTDAKWESEFDLYKASPQYQEINLGMEMGSIFESGTFKFIYFWEWIHRLWARVMGIVFVIPFVVFFVKGKFDTMLKRRLTAVFLLAGLAASFGWIMVASGLIERPWVNAYKLALHLSIAFITYSVLLWTFFKVQYPRHHHDNYGLSLRYRTPALIFTSLVGIQIFLGGVMSGMKAAVAYPTWPDMNGELVPSLLFDASVWSFTNFNYYDQHPFMPALIQTLHRGVAYVIVMYLVWMLYQIMRSNSAMLKRGGIFLGLSVFCQVCLGILTVINSKTYIPVGYGVWHQWVGLVVLSCSLYINYIVGRGKEEEKGLA